MPSNYLGLIWTRGLKWAPAWDLNSLLMELDGAVLAKLMLKWLQEGLDQTLACRARLAL